MFKCEKCKVVIYDKENEIKNNCRHYIADDSDDLYLDYGLPLGLEFIRRKDDKEFIWKIVAYCRKDRKYLVKTHNDYLELKDIKIQQKHSDKIKIINNNKE